MRRTVVVAGSYQHALDACREHGLNPNHRRRVIIVCPPTVQHGRMRGVQAQPDDQIIWGYIGGENWRQYMEPVFQEMVRCGWK